MTTPNSPSQRHETQSNAENEDYLLDPQVVLSHARTAFDDPQISQKISQTLVEIANKLKLSPEWIQSYSIEQIAALLRSTKIVKDTSMSIATAWILTHRDVANKWLYSDIA